MSTSKPTRRQPPLRLVEKGGDYPRLQHRVMVLEGQVNAMAQAWLYLAAEFEMQGGLSLAQMEDSLQNKHWPASIDVDGVARNTLYWLCHELSAARNVRAARRRDGEG